MIYYVFQQFLIAFNQFYLNEIYQRYIFRTFINILSIHEVDFPQNAF